MLSTRYKGCSNLTNTVINVTYMPQNTNLNECINRITAILKVETDIITNISASPIERAGIFVIMSVEAFRTDVIVLVDAVKICFTSD
jgi:hypothetical protein